MQKGFSGTSIYTDLKVQKESFCTHIDCEKDGRIIEQYYQNIVLFNVYFPNGKLNEHRYKVKIDFYKKLFEHCERVRQKGHSIIICGDFNIVHRDIDLKKQKLIINQDFQMKSVTALINLSKKVI